MMEIRRRAAPEEGGVGLEAERAAFVGDDPRETRRGKGETTNEGMNREKVRKKKARSATKSQRDHVEDSGKGRELRRPS